MPETPLSPEFDHLRPVAQAAMTGHAWEWSARGKHGYPQQVISQGDAVLVAECYESPDFPSAFAEFIATFDPPTVLALIDQMADVAALAEKWNSTPDYTPSEYDQGRIDQRHDMTTELLALIYPPGQQTTEDRP